MGYSKKMMGKEVGDAATYAAPHNMKGKAVGIASNPGKEPNYSKADTVNMSVGNIGKNAGEKQVKTSGIKIRGTGAAVNGVMARGPMA